MTDSIYLCLCVCRDLDQACMEAVAALLRGLPLQPEESDRGDLMEAKSQLFLKYTHYIHKFITDILTSSIFSDILRCL